MKLGLYYRLRLETLSTAYLAGMYSKGVIEFLAGIADGIVWGGCLCATRLGAKSPWACFLVFFQTLSI